VIVRNGERWRDKEMAENIARVQAVLPEFL
jgi:hypothetical protein